MNVRLATALSAGLIAAACSSTPQTRHATPAGTPVAYSSAYATSEQACADYGFPPGTIGYSNCVTRERAARASGRVSADYAEVNLTRDAQNACHSYGLQPYTAAYNRCVGSEIDSRRYRSEAVVPANPPYHTDRYGYRVDAQGYRVDANGYRMSQVPTAPSIYPAVQTQAYVSSYVETRPATTRDVAFRDEFGFRYDAQGNRIDRYGRIISPHSTQP